MSDITVPVLVVGGGGCGLTTSILLSEHGIDHHLVERHTGTSHLPKAHYLNQRTMEVLRQVGVADSIYEVGTPPRKMGKTRWVTSLGGDGELDGRTCSRWSRSAADGSRVRTQSTARARPATTPRSVSNGCSGSMRRTGHRARFTSVVSWSRSSRTTTVCTRSS